MAVSMGSGIRFIKKQISSLPNDVTEAVVHFVKVDKFYSYICVLQAKEILVDAIDRFLKEKIIYADDLISDYATSKINNGDVVLTYAWYGSILLWTII